MNFDKMQEMSLAEIRQVETDILQHFKTYCEKNNLSYFLSNGTLLGAVKYKGFIPWDDDIDVFVPRESYDRLIKEYKDTDRFKLFSHEREKGFLYPFAKLCDTTTIKKEENIYSKTQLGLDIDIFPLDVWGEDLHGAQQLEKEITANIKKLFFLKCEKATSVNPIKRMVKNIVLIIGRPHITKTVKKIINLSTQNISKENCRFKGCVSWCMYGEKEIIPAQVFDKTVQVEFEKVNYCAPAGYEIYLKSLYGDYKSDPPLEKQVTHHLYKAYRNKGG